MIESLELLHVRTMGTLGSVEQAGRYNHAMASHASVVSADENLVMQGAIRASPD